MINKNVLLNLKKGMEKHALTLPPSAERAQCYTIYSYNFLNDETIAQRILRDHTDVGHALRAARLISEAGLAQEIPNKNPRFFGTYIFQDGSEIS